MNHLVMRLLPITFAVYSTTWCFAAEETKASTEGLKSKELKVQIETLIALASAGKKASSAEEEIAALLTPTKQNHWLARWTITALTSISDHPADYMQRFRDVFTWKPKPEDDETPESLAEPKLPEELKEASDKAGRICIRYLISIYHSGEVARRWDAQVCLQSGVAPNETVVDELAKVIEDKKAQNPQRAACAKLIGFYGPYKQAADVLLVSIKDNDSDVRAESASSLGRLVEPFDTGRTNGFKTEPHPRREEAVKALIEALKDKTPRVRSDAATGIGYMCDQAKETLEPLKSALAVEQEKSVVTWLKEAIRYVERGSRVYSGR